MPLWGKHPCCFMTHLRTSQDPIQCTAAVNLVEDTFTPVVLESLADSECLHGVRSGVGSKYHTFWITQSSSKAPPLTSSQASTCVRRKLCEIEMEQDTPTTCSVRVGPTAGNKTLPCDCNADKDDSVLNFGFPKQQRHCHHWMHMS